MVQVIEFLASVWSSPRHYHQAASHFPLEERGQIKPMLPPDLVPVSLLGELVGHCSFIQPHVLQPGSLPCESHVRKNAGFPKGTINSFQSRNFNLLSRNG